MSLFHVQDSDRPMYVVAPSWGLALAAWEKRVREENVGSIKEDEAVEPAGISKICEDDELLIYGLSFVATDGGGLPE